MEDILLLFSRVVVLLLLVGVLVPSDPYLVSPEHDKGPPDLEGLLHAWTDLHWLLTQN